MIDFACPKCKKQFALPDHFAGKNAACKTCGSPFKVPGAMQAPASIPALAPKGAAPSVGAAPAPIKPAAIRITIPAAPAGAPAPAPRTTLSPRLRRLNADAQQMQKTFNGFPIIQIAETSGSPPDRYVLDYRVRSLTRGPNNVPIVREHHRVEILLTSEYPRQSPKCRMLTPIFHPNFDPTVICVGDHWTAGERLVDLVIRIAEMIAFQAYNLKSPLDGEAAMWTDLNRGQLPVDKRSMHPVEAGDAAR